MYEDDEAEDIRLRHRRRQGRDDDVVVASRFEGLWQD